MTDDETDPASIGPESTHDKSSGALSEQQRTWVREVAERLRQRHRQDETELHPAQDVIPDDRAAPAGGKTS